MTNTAFSSKKHPANGVSVYSAQSRHVDKPGRGHRDTGQGWHLVLLARVLSLQRVDHEASIGSLGDEGMPGSHNLKAKEAEGSEQGGSVLTVFGEADENVVGPELLLRELQESCETVLAALRQRPSRELDVEATTVPHRPPGDLLGLRERGLDAQDPGLVVRRWLLCHIQPLVGVEDAG